MKYIYATDDFNQKMCSLFDIEYTPMEIYRIPVEKDNSVMPANVGIDIGVVGKEPWNKGKKTGSLSEDHKKALSIAAKEYTKTEEHRNNLAKSLKGNQNGKNNTKPKSEEHKQKMKINSSKQYIVTGPFGVSFEILGLKNFCIDNNLSMGSMYNVLIKRQNSHRGWKIKKVLK